MKFYDVEDIQNSFNKIVKYSQHLEGEVNTDSLFKDWAENKKVLIDAWDGHLIKELGKVTFHMSQEQQIKTVCNFMNHISSLCTNEDYSCIKEGALTSFIFENRKNFFENVVKEEFVYHNIKVPKGMKIIRAFKYFCEDKDILNEIQSIASMMIQNDKVSGILCMSVHPLDFLSVSENAHNWRSCHALDGEYRAGNLNYMADSSTVICYLKSTHKAQLPNFPEDVKWNSKKWRMLLFFDNYYNTMMAGRQYPFIENSLLLYIRKEVENMFSGKFSGWFDNYHEYDALKATIEDEDESNAYEIAYINRYIPVSGRLLRFNKFVKNGEGTLQYNDLLYSSTYENPYYSFRLNYAFGGGYINSQYAYARGASIPKIVVGKKCKCLECGKEDIKMSESFLCPHCMIKENQADDSDDFTTCDICGARIYVDDTQEMINQFGNTITVCPDCAAEGIHCSNCNTLYEARAINENGLCPECANGGEDPFVF